MTRQLDCGQHVVQWSERRRPRALVATLGDSAREAQRSLAPKRDTVKHEKRRANYYYSQKMNFGFEMNDYKGFLISNASKN